MARRNGTFPATWSLADILDHIGAVPPHRIRARPAPGTATEKDVLRIRRREDRLYELVDGVLVEKAMGLKEAGLANRLGSRLEAFVDAHDLGFVAGADGAMRLMPGLVRIPDVSFLAWDQLPDRAYPEEPIPDPSPYLAVEVLSKDNTRQEMERKFKEYFLAATAYVWFVDPKSRTVAVHTSPDDATVLEESDTLEGEGKLAGFRLSLEELFALVSRTPRKGKKRRRR